MGAYPWLPMVSWWCPAVCRAAPNGSTGVGSGAVSHDRWEAIPRQKPFRLTAIGSESRARTKKAEAPNPRFSLARDKGLRLLKLGGQDSTHLRAGCFFVSRHASGVSGHAVMAVGVPRPISSRPARDDSGRVQPARAGVPSP